MTTFLLDTIVYNADPLLRSGELIPKVLQARLAEILQVLQLFIGLHKAAAFYKVSGSLVPMPNSSGCLVAHPAHHNTEELSLVLICPLELPVGPFPSNLILTHQLSLLHPHCMAFYKSVIQFHSLITHYPTHLHLYVCFAEPRL